ncbi:MAG TPA: TIM-barrel domain-containing protein [Terracidiphilus sp.]|nr:TIM-barrel domain-containing protein [Terracidiphilus sp.]
MCFFRPFSALVVVFFAANAPWAQQSAGPPSAVTPLLNGIEVRAGDVHERVTALRDDVLRIRIWHGENPPEDASWAVLSQARGASVAVTSASGSAIASFRTSALAVAVDPATLELTVRDSSGNVVSQDARPVRFDGNEFRIYKSMPIDEHYFGLGDKTGPLDRRNESFTLWNTDAYRFQESTDPLYKAIPYFMTFRAGRAAGVLLDNTWRSSFDFGKELPDAYSFGSVNGPIDYYFFYGPTPKQVIETYAWLTGTPPLPPLWSLGFQQSRYSYESQSRLLEIAKRLRADRIPADALYLDIDYQDHNRPFTVNTKTFPDLKGLMAKLKAEDLHAVMITDLHIANYPEPTYPPYDTGVAGDNFVKNPDGSIYSGKVWPGPSLFPDFTRQQTRAWWGSLYREFKSDGADGFWNDMNEPSVFDTPTSTMPIDVIHRIDEPGFATRTATHAEIHNVYGMENSRATYDGLLAIDPHTRPFVLTRATYAGGQRFAATWTGDNSSSWNHLRLATPMIENLGLSGFAFTGADVGGYAGSPSMDLLTKWFEIAAFQPIDRDHSEKGTADQEPWVGGLAQEDIRRHFIETRYQLMPYLYTLADEASRTGLPMVRPLFFEFPSASTDGHPIDLDNGASGEFMLGSDLLIAPSPYPEEPDAYSVELPTARWYDFWTGEPVKLPPPDPPVPGAPDRTVRYSITVTPKLAELPVYVRASAIVPIEPLVQSTSETPKGPLTLRFYIDSKGEIDDKNEAGDNCAGQLYQDDGKSFAYKSGAFLRMSFSCQVSKDGLHITIGGHQGSYPAWWKEIRAEIYGWTPEKGTAAVDSKPIQLTRESHAVVFTVPDDGKGLEATLQ